MAKCEVRRQEPLRTEKSPPSPPLLPAPSDPCQSLLTAGSKRDHDEWLGWWGRVGGASAPLRLKARQEGPVRRSSRSQRGESGHGHFPRIAGRHPGGDRKRRGPCRGDPPVVLQSSSGLAMRQGMRPAPRAIGSKLPIGRRGSSLVPFADYPRGATASPAPLHRSSTGGQWPGRGLGACIG